VENPISNSQENIGNPENKGVDKIESTLYNHAPGKVIISNSEAEKSASVIIDGDTVKITDASLGSSIVVDGAVSIQGNMYFTGKGDSIKKGEFTENPRSSKIFTYTETVQFESIPKELMSTVTGKLGANLGTGMDGIVPIITDISAGPLPHFHTISMKHVHRLEPAYLYRVPSVVQFFQGAMSSLTQFFSI
jgi:hypothetical protein